MSDEGEDTPQRPKRSIRKVALLSSASDSDSDDGVVAATRRKRMRVVSEDGSDSSDSSDSSVLFDSTRRRRALPRLHDSDGASDATASGASSRGGSSGRAGSRGRSPRAPHASTTHCPPPDESRAGSSRRSTCGFASDSSEGNSDKCSICLLRFTNQEVGTPETCEHVFCLDCITEWSKNVNTCPVDRITFNSIVVRAFAGGRVLRSEPVSVVVRRPSVDVLVVEDMTVCEVCGRTDDEESMLLCDGCDLGYHMQCLTPPLHRVPVNRWLCPNCFNLLDMNLSDLDDMIPDITSIDDFIRVAPMLAERARLERLEQPSTSSAAGPAPSRSSRSSRAPRSSRSAQPSGASTRRRTNTTTARRRRTTRSTTVIIEYEQDENGKRPSLRRVKRKHYKRKTRKRQPRTAARRTQVRASVRAKLASMRAERRLELAQPSASTSAGSSAAGSLQELSARRHRAGIPALSLLGNPNQLDYFSEDEEHDAGLSHGPGPSLAVAVRPTSHILTSIRQARRKMVTVSSPQHASSAPDILSSILHSQTLLHSKNSVVSISVDGNVNIKLETREHKPIKKPSEPTNDSRVDVLKADDTTRKVPSYPGQSRGGGWGGGYRGNYHREQGTTGFGRGSYNEGNFGGGYQNRQGNTYQNPNMRREDGDTFNNYSRRPPQYSQNEDSVFDRNRRHSDTGRGPNQNQHGTHNQRHEPGRYGPGSGPTWQPYGAAPAAPAPAPTRAPAALPPTHRHSFGGFDNPLDMRTGHIPHHPSGFKVDDNQTRDRPHPYRPLPEPPVFQFEKAPEVEKSEDERSDSSLVIDTDKYDPTEPTKDDDSGDEERVVLVRGERRDSAEPPVTSAVPTVPTVSTAPAPPVAMVEPLPSEPVQLDVRSAIASLDTSGLSVPHSVLDSAVRQVLKEHRDLLAPAARPASASDDDSDGDCPNFSIYSATSVHIANNSSVLGPEAPHDVPQQDNLEDLVQEDDTPTPEPDEPESEPDPPTPPNYTDSIKKKEDEYKEKVSKRCPITTNTRNPIKIKLNTPSLIKRHVSLYDEEEEVEGAETTDAIADEPTDVDPLPTTRRISSPKNENNKKAEARNNDVTETPKQTKDSKELSPVDEDIDDTEQGVMTLEPHSKEDSPQDEIPAATESHQDEESDDLDELMKEKLGESEEIDQKSENELNSDDEASESGALDRTGSRSPGKISADRNDDALEKMTESISETEDERSYTPCLDENKSKDTSLETEKDKGIEGLDTEMISEDEGNEMFSEEERVRSEPSRASPPPRATPTEQPEPSVDKEIKPEVEVKKKKKKDSKKDVKDRSKGKRKSEAVFRKLSKSGKERNYRERDKEGAGERERRDSTDSAEREKRKKKRKEKRKDLERYDVRTVVSEKRRKRKDPFGRDVSPRARSRSPSLSRSPPLRRSISRGRRSVTRVRRSPSPPRRAPSRPRRTTSRPRASVSPPRRRRSLTPRPSPSPLRVARSPSPRRRRRSLERAKRAEPRRRRSAGRERKRRRSVSGSKSPRPKSTKRKKRARSERPASRRRSPRRKSPRRRRVRRRSGSRGADASPGRAPPADVPPEPARWSPGSVDSRLASPRTPPPVLAADDAPVRRRRDPERARHRRVREAGGASKEVFTSGDNILVSVSFKEQERDGDEDRRERRRERRRRRRRTAAPEADTGAARPVAIIDLERSPFRELTPSPRNVIVLSDSEPGERESGPAPEPAAPEPVGPKTPPEPVAPEAAPEPAPEEPRGPNTPPEPPDSPDAYDPYEPTRSASASPSPSPVAASPPRTTITLETAQKTNMSADEVLDRRPLSPIEKVMALLQSTREVPPDPPPAPGAASEAAPLSAASAAAAAPPAPSAPPAATGPPVRIVLPEPTRASAPKLFLAKPSPIKSDPIKPMQAAKLPRPAPAPAPAPADSPYSPYSPGSSDFGELFEPPAPHAANSGGGVGVGSVTGVRRDPFDALAPRPRRKRNSAAKVPVKLNNKGKMHVGVKIDEDNLKILDDLPSSAVEMQVKSKFLKKLNRQERVVEEVKLVLKPHYNKKHVTKDEYKDILRRAVPKICHNKSGEINPTKIQALIEAYVKKIRKKHKLGLV